VAHVPNRVLVAEDFEPFRKFLTATLQNGPGLQVICEVSDGLEAVRKAQELQPDLILLDIGLPNLDGIKAARIIRGLCHKSKILFVSQESSPEVIQAALNTGAQGYVTKINAGSQLVTAVETILRGEQFVPHLEV
jgi:two-component system, NarL family, nitrate/nitrite response regulator NarL